MRREYRWAAAAAAAVALTLATVGSEPYARLAVPYYAMAARLIALAHPWQIVDLEIGPDPAGPGRVVQLTGMVRERDQDSTPDAKVICRLQVAAIAQSPVIFWTLLLLWPAKSGRQRLAFLAWGIPVFLCLEAATSVCQLLNPLAYASAVLSGDPEPMTLWERWSRFNEAGGRVVLAVFAAILTVTIARGVARRPAQFESNPRR